MTKVVNHKEYQTIVSQDGDFMIDADVPGTIITIVNEDFNDRLYLVKRDLPGFIKLLQEFQSKLSDLESV